MKLSSRILLINYSNKHSWLTWEQITLYEKSDIFYFLFFNLKLFRNMAFILEQCVFKSMSSLILWSDNYIVYELCIVFSNYTAYESRSHNTRNINCFMWSIKKFISSADETINLPFIFLKLKVEMVLLCNMSTISQSFNQCQQYDNYSSPISFVGLLESYINARITKSAWTIITLTKNV